MKYTIIPKKILMKIDIFFNLSLGIWKSMRSGHSLAFQQFEEIINTITISKVRKDDHRISELIKNNKYKDYECLSPISISWEAKSNWSNGDLKKTDEGLNIIIPLKLNEKEGILINSLGYTEREEINSKYLITDDGTIVLSTKYSKLETEERIWFLSKYIRCRSSVTKAKNSNGILQTSYATEIKQISSS